ncbi:Dabb family protein [Nonomuraea sp. NPDC048916]|uniref:Dabb family protein n=1 Tax=Nonomuraea sp. NPDC048916 TaxID=3154232 RepID=UPI0033E360BF
MFRHVVLFKWSEEAGEPVRAAAVSALRHWAVVAAEFGSVTVGTDAALREGNHDVAVVADFPDREAYLRYTADERHLAMVAEHITPNASSRAAVQHEL